MPGAILPFERVRKRKRLKPTDRIFGKSPRELMNTVLDELNLKFDRDGHVRTCYSLRHTYYLPSIARRGGHLSGRQELPHQRGDDREILRAAFEEQHRRIRRQCPQGAARAGNRPKEGREGYNIAAMIMFAVACFDGQAMGLYQAGVVELVDARDLKSCSARSVGSIPTVRTIHDRRL